MPLKHNGAKNFLKIVPIMDRPLEVWRNLSVWLMSQIPLLLLSSSRPRTARTVSHVLRRWTAD